MAEVIVISIAVLFFVSVLGLLLLGFFMGGKIVRITSGAILGFFVFLFIVELNQFNGFFRFILFASTTGWGGRFGYLVGKKKDQIRQNTTPDQIHSANSDDNLSPDFDYSSYLASNGTRTSYSSALTSYNRSQTSSSNISSSYDPNRSPYSVSPFHPRHERTSRSSNQIRVSRAPKLKGRYVAQWEREQIARSYGWKCAYCKTSLDDTNLTINRIQPLSRGGKDDISNMQAICRTCGYQKGGKTDLEFIEYRNSERYRYRREYERIHRTSYPYTRPKR